MISIQNHLSWKTAKWFTKMTTQFRLQLLNESYNSVQRRSILNPIKFNCIFMSITGYCELVFSTHHKRVWWQKIGSWHVFHNTDIILYQKFNNVIKSDPYTNMTLLLYCCQKECTQLLIKGIYPNNHDENSNTAQQFWKTEVALNMFYPYLNGPLHTHCSQQICWAFTHVVTGTQVVIFVWYVPVHAAALPGELQHGDHPPTLFH
jgi:hypothetical protein